MMFVPILLTLAVCLAACGDVLLSRGMQAHEVTLRGPRDVPAVLALCFTEPRILLAVACLGAYFGAYMAALTQAQVSVANPITALSMLGSAAWAALMMRERVGPQRWAGIVLVVVGSVLVGASTQ